VEIRTRTHNSDEAINQLANLDSLDKHNQKENEAAIWLMSVEGISIIEASLLN